MEPTTQANISEMERLSKLMAKESSPKIQINTRVNSKMASK